MSKLWKGVKKTFKKITKFVKKRWKIIVIAAAIYFTAGMALAAMPSTAAFSAAMPGFGVGGMFSNAAVAMGATGAAGSGIAGTVAANAAAAAGSAAAVGAGSAAAGGSGLGLSAGGAGSAAGGSVLSATSQAAALTGAGTAAPALGAAGGMAGSAGAAAAAGSTGVTTAAISGMSGLEKVALASTIFKGAGALLSDSPDDEDRKGHKRRWNQSYGIGRDGTGEGYGGLVENAFGDKYGGDGAVQDTDAPEPATPWDAPAPAMNTSGQPFASMDQSETDAAGTKQAVGGGYSNRNYMPV